MSFFVSSDVPGFAVPFGSVCLLFSMVFAQARLARDRRRPHIRRSRLSERMARDSRTKLLFSDRSQDDKGPARRNSFREATGERITRRSARASGTHAPIYVPPLVLRQRCYFAAIEVQFNSSRRKAAMDRRSAIDLPAPISTFVPFVREEYIVIYRPRLIDSSITVMVDGVRDIAYNTRATKPTSTSFVHGAREITRTRQEASRPANRPPASRR